MPAAGLGDCSVVLYRQFQPFWTQDYAESIFCLYFPEMRRATYVSLIVCVFICLNLFETIMISDFTSHTTPVSYFSKQRCVQHFMWNRKCHLPFYLFVYYLIHHDYWRYEQITCLCLTLHCLWVRISFLFSKLADVVLIFIIYGVFLGNQSQYSHAVCFVCLGRWLMIVTFTLIVMLFKDLLNY